MKVVVDRLSIVVKDNDSYQKLNPGLLLLYNMPLDFSGAY